MAAPSPIDNAATPLETRVSEILKNSGEPLRALEIVGALKARYRIETNISAVNGILYRGPYEKTEVPDPKGKAPYWVVRGRLVADDPFQDYSDLPVASIAQVNPQWRKGVAIVAGDVSTGVYLEVAAAIVRSWGHEKIWAATYTPAGKTFHGAHASLRSVQEGEIPVEAVTLDGGKGPLRGRMAAVHTTLSDTGVTAVYILGGPIIKDYATRHLIAAAESAAIPVERLSLQG